MTQTKKQLVKNGQPVERATDYARRLWLAGLGVYAGGEQNGGKLFQALVKEGEKFEARTRKEIDDRVEAARQKVAKNREKVAERWEKNNEILQKGVTSILRRFGLSTNEDFQELSKRVDVLNANMQKLAGHDVERSSVRNRNDGVEEAA